jgi:signal transduction histidine kinase
MSAAAKSDPLRAAYHEHNARLLTRSVIVANIIGMIGMPSGAALDYFLYPQNFLEFLGIRVGNALVLLAVIGILVAGKRRPQLMKAKVFGVISALSITTAISLMIYQTEGVISPYFAGLNLVLMTFASLVPWSVMQTAIMCVGSLLVYVLACVANPSVTNASFFPYFGFNSSFILIATIVCIGTTIFLSRIRFEDFRLRHQLDVQNRELQDLDRLKTQFFSNVSHELRTPLTLILGPVENLLARAGGLDAKIHEGLILVHRNSLRLLKLINDLLDLTRLDLGGEALRNTTFPLGPWVKGVVESVRHLGLSKQLRIKVEEGDPSVEAYADPARLEKVLLNLLTNAIKYTPSGGSITVRWRGSAAGIELEVADTGVGIPPQDLKKVFDRFHQVQSNAGNQLQGVGIGLALAKELVEQHGGTISLESVVGTGSVFCVSLPASKTDGTGPVATPAEETAESVEPFEKAFRSADRTLRTYGNTTDDEGLPVVGSGSEVVLVADDENDMREFIVSMLVEDYRVVQTRHGGDVAALVAEHRPALVLLDWMMPGKSGLEVCQELRAEESLRDLKIVLLTARIDEKSKLDALKAGADDFLTKPFSSIEVKTRVANLLGVARLQKDLRVRNDELSATVAKLQTAEMMLIQSEKMNAIGSLSAGLLHEINNPLNYTMTAMSIVQQRRETLSPDMQELVADIEEGMVRVRDVITNLKDFAYPEKPGQMSTFPLGDALRDARKMTARELDGVHVEGGLPDDLFVKGQKTQLTHLFINLLSNAARALGKSANGDAKIISVRATVAEELATIEFADNGPGIPPEIINRVFEPFFTTQAVGQGMGMGLSVCHTIMESHGGGIRVGNRSEGGAIFTIHIPVAERAPKLC